MDSDANSPSELTTAQTKYSGRVQGCMRPEWITIATLFSFIIIIFIIIIVHLRVQPEDFGAAIYIF